MGALQKKVIEFTLLLTWLKTEFPFHSNQYNLGEVGTTIQLQARLHELQSPIHPTR